VQTHNLQEAQADLFASLHSSLAALEAAIGERIQTNADIQKNSDWAKAALSEVEPTAWSTRIEAARGDADELSKLRFSYAQFSIGALGAFLNLEVARANVTGGQHPLNTAIVDAIIAHGDIVKGGEHDWLKPIFKARINAASKLNNFNDSWLQTRFEDGLISRLRLIQIKAFRVFLDNLKTRQYPLVLGTVVPSYLHYEGHPTRVWHARFVDCIDSEHPASRRLADLQEQGAKALTVCWQAHAALKTDHEAKLDEVHHANVLLNFLNADESERNANGYRYKVQQKVDAQNKSRYEYETRRQTLLGSLRNFRGLMREIVKSQRESAAEGEALLAEMEASKHSSSDRSLTLAIIVNNCLATDVHLASWVKQLNEMQNSFDNDLSGGAGLRSLDAVFAEVRDTYEFAVGKRRDELAEKSTT